MYEVFVPLNAKVVADYARSRVWSRRERATQPGVQDRIDHGLHPRIMERLLPVAARQGFAPDTNRMRAIWRWHARRRT